MSRYRCEILISINGMRGTRKVIGSFLLLQADEQQNFTGLSSKFLWFRLLGMKLFSLSLSTQVVVRVCLVKTNMGMSSS